jgi:diadenylate cyclase
MLSRIQTTINTYLGNLHMPTVRWTDIVEILIIAFLVYHILVWIKDTKAWSLFKGLVIILVFILFAAIFNMTTILWIVKNIFSIAVIAIVVVLQPELRKALETLGRQNLFSSMFTINGRQAGLSEGRFSDHTVNEIVRASVEMSKVRTGALMVIEQTQPLSEYERTGIEIDAEISSQLLINIFEHNTPLHDGAVIIKGNRITSATCYLPLSDNMQLSKDLGTRHRAGVGISEATDSLTVIVSEETGYISVAYHGTLSRNLSADELKERLESIQNKKTEEKKRKNKKGRPKNVA